MKFRQAECEDLFLDSSLGQDTESIQEQKNPGVGSKEWRKRRMIYKKVSKIQEEISAIGVGTWNMGGDWDSSDEKKAIEVVHAAIDMGINLFDVAPVYGMGISETVLGKALKEGGRRNRVLIASKAGLPWDEKGQTQNNLTKASLLKEIDDSLLRLQTDHIDIYQMHWPDHSTPLEETAEALRFLKESGKIRYVGMSNYSQKEVETMMTMVDVECQQGLYNMLERNTSTYHGIPLEYRTEEEVFPFVREHGQAFLPYSPLFQGLLAGKFLDGIDFSEKDIRSSNPKLAGEQFGTYVDIARKLKAFADEIGHPMNELTFNWMRQREEVTSIIAGASSVEQLKKNVHSITWDISDEQMEKINSIIEPVKTV